MKLFFFILSSILYFSSFADAAVTFSPGAVTSGKVEQIRVQFGESMKTSANPFSVECDPVTSGYGNWTDNNTTWVYNLDLPKNRWEESMPLPGGASCKLVQASPLEAVSGVNYKVGSLKHQFVVDGPNISDVLFMPGFNQELRENEPVFMIVFDGDIDRNTLINSSGSFLWYPIDTGYPSEKILLSALPSNEINEVFNLFKSEYDLEYRGVDLKGKNWALVTADRNLIPGADINLSVSGVVSSYSSKAVVADNHTELKVRDNFKANVNCSRSEVGSAFCMPEGSPSVEFNSSVTWNLAKSVYIEYVPFDSKNGKTVKAYPSPENVISNWLGYWVAQGLNIAIDDSVKVSSLDFSKVKVAPQTIAKVVFPSDLKDVDGRKLGSNYFELSFESYSETVSFPENLTIMERNVPANKALPVAVMNLNQIIKVNKSGANVNNWEPIVDMKTIISLIDLYGGNRNVEEGEAYVSPLATLGLKTVQEEVRLSGEINKRTFLSLDYGSNKKSGVYAVEIQSELSTENVPAYNLTLLTDLNVHLKKGANYSTAWVTSYSTGLPVGNVKIDIYDCNKSISLSGVTDAAGVYKFSHKNVSKNCAEKSNSYLLDDGDFFVAAKTNQDMAFTHSSYTAEGSWAFSSPGVEYFSSDITDSSVYIHSLIGINLVKPGQTVPVQFTAVVPDAKGFRSVDSSKLPSEVHIVSDSSEVSYTLPLVWNNGVAEFKWEVPSTAQLGSYSFEIKNPGSRWGTTIGSNIEVSEFQVPLMSANLNIESGPLVKPSELNVNGLIRFANGIGAKDQDVEVSYFFTPASLNVENYESFDFVQGEFDKKAATNTSALPDSENVVLLDGLKTDSEGSINLDLLRDSGTASSRSLSDLLAEVERPYKLVVRMKYKDQMGEFQTASTAESIYNSSAYVGTNIKVGPIAEAQLLVVNLGVDGKTYTNMSDLEIKVMEIKTHVIGEEVFGGFIKNTFESELVATGWKSNCNLLNGVASCSAKGLNPGSYLLTAASKSNNQKTFSKFKVDSDNIVSSEAESYYFDEEVKGVKLAADKEFYKGGEIAKLTFESPFADCTALVTLERSEVIESFIDTQACKNGFVKVQLNAENAPNIFASVYFVTGRSDDDVNYASLDLGKPSYRIGYSNLKVDWSQFALNVDVKMDKAEYKPGEIANASVKVDAQVGSITDATVTFFALEEKILELKDNTTMKILDSLMGMRNHTVNTLNNYALLNSVAEVEAVMAAEAALGAKGGEEGGSGSEFESFQRKLFDALVVWESNVPVVNGMAQVSFKLNDKLTKFKVFAVVSDSSNKYGTGDAGYLATQEVQTYSNISSVARIGDEYPATITVQNNGKQSDTYTVVVDYTFTNKNGPVAVKSVSSSLTVDKGSSVSLEVGDIKIPEGTLAVDYAITVYNENGMVVDALTPPTQVVSPSVPLTVQEEYLVQVDQGKTEFSLQKNAKAIVNEGAIETKVFNSLVKTVDSSIRESVSNDVFSDVTVSNKLLKSLIESESADQNVIAKAYAELLSQLDSKGFIKYYSGASTGDFWLTAEVVELIAMKPWALDMMPIEMKSKLVASFISVIEGKIEPTYIAGKADVISWTAAKIKASNALLSLDKKQAGYAESVLVQVNKSGNYKDYSVDAMADFAVLTAKLHHDTLMVSPVMKYINESLLVVRNTSAVLKGTASYSWYGYSDEVIATSKLIKAQSLAAKYSNAPSSQNYLDNLVVGIIQANKAGQWYTMNTKAWVLSGLTEFANTYESDAVNGETAISSTETSLVTNVKWTSSAGTNGISSSWQNPGATVTLDHNGAGKPWVSVIAKSAVKLTADNFNGLKITKVITNKTKAGSEYSAGDLIQVDITIDSPSAVPHVALFDPIPSGANILSEGWGAYSSAQKTYSGYKVYFNYLASGSVKISYQYQLNSPGSFELPQTRVEALYEPGLFGEVPNGTVVVTK